MLRGDKLEAVHAWRGGATRAQVQVHIGHAAEDFDANMSALTDGRIP